MAVSAARASFLQYNCGGWSARVYDSATTLKNKNVSLQGKGFINFIVPLPALPVFTFLTHSSLQEPALLKLHNAKGITWAS